MNMWRNRRDEARFRQASRLRDVAESQTLLLELVTCEPILQQSFKIIESTCLSQGIHCRLDGRDVSDDFQRHMDEFYIPFCKAAIRAMFAYGFVPWRLRKIAKGDEVPEVLPAGTFSWHTEVGPVEQGHQPVRYGPKRPMKLRYHNDDTLMVVYRLTPLAGNWKEEDINVYITTPPGLDISYNSQLHATVSSPLSHLLVDYRNLRQAQIRRSHADAWNTTAKIITQFDPKLRTDDQPTQYLMDFVDSSHFNPPVIGQHMYPPLAAHNVWQREAIIRNQFDSQPSTHNPDVYALPRDHSLALHQMLVPCEDLAWLLDKFRRDVASVTGVPYEMLVGQGNRHETVRKTMASGRLFSTNMHEICRHLQALLLQVYRKTYRHDAKVDFTLVPMPRLEVETVADFKTLFEIGALTPDMSLKLSKILLGEEPTSKRPRYNSASRQLFDDDKQQKDSKASEEKSRASDVRSK